jgi:hypothetical protein
MFWPVGSLAVSRAIFCHLAAGAGHQFDAGFLALCAH